MARHISRYPELGTGVSVGTPSESFTLQANSGGGFNPNDASTYYIGQGIVGATLSAGSARIYIQKKSILKKCVVFIRSNAGSNEQSTISILVNGVTEYTITASLTVAAGNNTFTNTSLNILLNPGDYICVKRVTPTRVTNPTSTNINVVFGFDCSPGSQYGNYVLQSGLGGSGSPVASTTYFMDENTFTTTVNASRIYIPFTGTIIACYLYVRCSTNSSNEQFTYSLRKNDTTDYTITTTAKLDTTSNTFINASMSGSVTQGDYVCLKFVSPAWVTAPTGIVHKFIFVVQR